MSAQRCLSCDHENARTAKFCEECGSALNLKLCEECEAINEADAGRCHKCHAPLPAKAMTAAAKPSASRVPLALAVAALSAGLIALLGGAALAYHVFYREPPALAVPSPRAAPAPASVAENKKPAPAPAIPESRGVTHTRAAARAPKPKPAAEPKVLTEETFAPRPVPVTHTKRASQTTPAKSESDK